MWKVSNDDNMTTNLIAWQMIDSLAGV